MSASEASSLVGRRLGRFRILSRIGQGGLATVWRAHDELLGRDVALKVLNESLAQSPKVRKRFVHEAQAASLLEHPGIVTVFDAGEDDGLAYMALTLIDGETISDIASRRLIPIDEAMRIVTAAADALTHAHARGVIHRDVSGRNVMIARDGRVFVLDFGLALVAGQSRVTTSETTLGTIAYMSPEALQGSSLDARADVYGMGVVLFEVLTGAYPHAGDRTEQLAFAKLNVPARRPSELRPEVPPQIDWIVQRTLARDPSERYGSMGDLLADLRVFGRGGGIPVPENPPRVIPVPRASRQDAGDDDTQATIPERAYVAILPFTVVSDTGPGDKERFVASRLADGIAAALGSARRVQLVPVPEAEGTRAANEDDLALARRLGANLLLMGCVARAGGRLRVTYSIRDPVRGIQISGDVIDGTDVKPFDLEDAVAASIRRALGVEGPALSHATVRRPTDGAESDRYQIARRYLERYDHEPSVDGAIRILEELVAGTGRDSRHDALLARACLAKHRLTKDRTWEVKAAAACERARSEAPDFLETRIALADLEIATGRGEDACAHLASALADAPEDVDLRITLARAAVACARYTLAEESALAAVSLRPDDWRGHNWLGVASYERGQHEAAAIAWSRVVDLVPDSALGQRNLGSAFYRLDRLEEAANAYRASISVRPTAEGYGNLGTVLYYLGDTPGSIAALERAVALLPGDPLKWGNLGNACSFSEGHQARGREALERAVLLARDHLDSDPADAQLWARMSGWLAHLKLPDDALQAVQRALALHPEEAEVLAMAAETHHRLGNESAALDCLGRAFERGYGVEEARRSHEFAPLHGKPNFERLLAEAAARRGRNEFRPSRRPR